MKGFFSGAELQMVEAVSTTPKCGACGLYKTCKSPKMPYSGQGKRKILIVGEAPGETEDERGKQFVGKSGEYLRQALRKLGVDMVRDCWLTNALICRPPSNTITNDNAVDYCRPNLIRTLEELQPDVVIPLGGVAVESVLGYAWGPSPGGISEWVGVRAPAQKINAWVCPNWHPSYLIREERNRTLHAYFDKYLLAAVELEEKPYPDGNVPDYREKVLCIYDVNTITSCLAMLHDPGTVIAFDYETNMLKPDGDDARIVSMSVCRNGKKTIAFPMLPGVMDAVGRLLHNPDVKKIASNMKFEDRWTTKFFGAPVKGWLWDTMIAAHLIDGRPGICSIKFQSFALLGQPRYDDHISPYLKPKGNKEGGNAVNQIHEIPLPELLMYNGLDSHLEYLVAVEQNKRVKGFTRYL